MTRPLEPVEIFHGELTPNRAVIHVRLPIAAAEQGVSLVGFIRGPRCSHGSTLPATYRLVEQAPRASGNQSISSTGLITEPVFWTPDWPALYDVTVELRRGSETIDQSVRTIGLRPLAIIDKGLHLGGKFWVLRGVRQNGNLDVVIDECREHAAALMAPAELLDEPLLTKASEQGVFIVAELSPNTSIDLELSRLGRFPAVAMAVLPAGEIPLGHVPGNNILLAQRVGPQSNHVLQGDVRVVLADVVNEPDFAAWASMLPRPVIACRPLARPAGIAEARAECDRLQRDLAPYGQFAGYIV